MSIGERIRKLRRERDWTQAELGQHVGIDGRNINKYESGRLRPSTRTLSKFADAFEVTVDELLSDGKEHRAEAVIEDREMLRLFQQLNDVAEPDREAVKRIITAVVARHQMKKVVGE